MPRRGAEAWSHIVGGIRDYERSATIREFAEELKSIPQVDAIGLRRRKLGHYFSFLKIRMYW